MQDSESTVLSAELYESFFDVGIAVPVSRNDVSILVRLESSRLGHGNFATDRMLERVVDPFETKRPMHPANASSVIGVSS